MVYKRIVVPHDGSQPSKNALEVAKKLIADDPSSTLHIISVIPAGAVAFEVESPSDLGLGVPMLLSDPDSYERVIENTRANAMSALNEAIGDTLDNVKCNVQLATPVASRAADGIVDYANEHKCEIIVMGRRGLGSLRGMLGSVSYGVLHQADMPVLTVK